MAAESANPFRERRRIGQFLSDRIGNDVTAKHVPGCFPGFRAVEWPLRCGDFTPSGLRSIRHADENDVTILCGTKTGFERMQEAHLQLADLNSLDEHAMLRAGIGIRSTRPCVETGNEVVFVEVLQELLADAELYVLRRLHTLFLERLNVGGNIDASNVTLKRDPLSSIHHSATSRSVSRPECSCFRSVHSSSRDNAVR